jgi:hypothetical protein
MVYGLKFIFLLTAKAKQSIFLLPATLAIGTKKLWMPLQKEFAVLFGDKGCLSDNLRYKLITTKKFLDICICHAKKSVHSIRQRDLPRSCPYYVDLGLLDPWPIWLSILLSFAQSVVLGLRLANIGDTVMNFCL